MAARVQQPIVININIIQPDSEEVAKLIEMLTGIEGATAAATHRVKAAAAPKALADAPAGSTDKDLRDYAKAVQKDSGVIWQDPEGNTLPLRGRLNKWWRDTIEEHRAASAAADAGEEMLEADVVEEPASVPEPAAAQPRKWRGHDKGKAPAAK